jgi:hypothetical protein
MPLVGRPFASRLRGKKEDKFLLSHAETPRLHPHTYGYSLPLLKQKRVKKLLLRINPFLHDEDRDQATE